MSPFTPKHFKDGPEAIIQRRIIAKLKEYDWYVKVFVGNALQHGVPDLYAAKRNFGERWIEVKNRDRFSFTERQSQNFPLMHAAGVGIWILFDSTPEELAKLSKPANWGEVYFRWANGGYDFKK